MKVGEVWRYPDDESVYLVLTVEDSRCSLVVDVLTLDAGTPPLILRVGQIVRDVSFLKKELKKWERVG